MKIKNHGKRIASIASLVGVFSLTIYPLFVERVQAQTDNVVVTLNVTSGITISDGANTLMAPNLSVSVNESIGSSSWTVVTNSLQGYSLNVTASTDEAMRHTGSSTIQFQDFASGTSTPQLWDSAKGSNIYTFGFSAFGTDVNTATWGTGASCGTGGLISATQRYAGFAGPTARTIATKSSVTPVAGVASTICFAAEQVGVFAPAGQYTATITGTAVVN
jgi:hypothetical protein